MAEEIHLIDEQFSDYLGGALAPAVRQAVFQHLADCAACASRLAELRATLIKEAPSLTPPDPFPEGPAQPVEEARMRWGLRGKWAAACAVIAALWVLQLSRRHPTGVQPALSPALDAESKPQAKTVVPYSAKPAEGVSLSAPLVKKAVPVPAEAVSAAKSKAALPAPSNVTPWKGATSGITAPRTVAIQSEEEWLALWKEHVAGQVPPLPLPNVNFARYTVVGVFAGNKPTAGFSIVITRIQFKPDGVHVAYHEVAPDPSMAVADVVTQPFELRIIPHKNLPITFEEVP
jgi:hypothetical protein